MRSLQYLAMARSDRPRIEGTDPDDLHRRWIAIAAHHDPLDIPRLFERVCDGRIEHGMERISALSDHPAHEAIRRQLLKLLSSSTAYPNPTSKPFWLLVMMLLIRRARPSTHRKLLKAHETPPNGPISYWLIRQVQRLGRLLHERPAQFAFEQNDDTIRAALQSALRAHRRGQQIRVLREVLIAWRACRDPRLAAVIDTIDQGLQAKQPPAPKSGRIRWFHEQLPGAEPESIGPLLTVLNEAGPDVVIERLRMLIAKPADPRIARAVWQLVTDGPFDLMTPLGLPLLTAMMVHADPRATDALRPLTAHRAEHRLIFDGVLEALADRPALTEATRAMIGKLHDAFGSASGHIRKAQRDESELLEAIYEAPDDDAPRAIYADWLIERKDPRGEFIMLQLKAAQDELRPLDVNKMKMIAKRHSARWLGPLSAVIPTSARVFERGFLVAASLGPRHQRAFDATVSDPRWRTVRALDSFGFDPTPLLASACGANVVHVGGLSESVLLSVREAPQPWNKIRKLGCASTATRLQPAALSALKNMPGLHTVRFGILGTTLDMPHDAEEAQSVLETLCAMNQHLHTIGLSFHPNSWSVWQEAFERSGRSVRTLEFHYEGNGTLLKGGALTRLFSDFRGARTLVDHVPMQHRGRLELGGLLQQLRLLTRIRALIIRADQPRLQSRQMLVLSELIKDLMAPERVFWRPPAR